MQRQLKLRLLFRFVILCLFIVLLSVDPAFAWDGKCVSVADGDTITAMHDGKGERIRLYGIDSPENGQDFGNRSKQFTSEMVFGKIVTVVPRDTDRYGRTVGMVYVGGRSLNEELLRSGYAWVYLEYCKDDFCSSWKDIEAGARAVDAGLWSHKEPIPPWEYRHGGGRSNAPVKAVELSTEAYHGNASSHVFHRANCRYYNCKNCTVVFQTREAALKAGYRPCKICKP